LLSFFVLLSYEISFWTGTQIIYGFTS